MSIHNFDKNETILQIFSTNWHTPVCAILCYNAFIAHAQVQCNSMCVTVYSISDGFNYERVSLDLTLPFPDNLGCRNFSQERIQFKISL